jgi:hypothetical protein
MNRRGSEGGLATVLRVADGTDPEDGLVGLSQRGLVLDGEPRQRMAAAQL